MNKLQREPVIDTMYRQGRKMSPGLAHLIARHEISHFASLAGLPVWSFLLLKDCEPYTVWEIKTLFLQEMLARGIMTLGSHNMNYAHGDAEVAKILIAYGEVLPILKDAVDNRKMGEYLLCQPIEPLFRVR